ncbi:hypothetical protein IV203_025378 [Nitzschia inconspicua]|uniref:Uncharacterized protein n=1 Tax=Nitzschia inconspicua TaxID=303405 RepID=A0A9K3PA74_9STRA|nr:hypothetical protein IV203_024815 [Nitzschia inconspicua]KAG7362494.1 hypothetical protein IV203_025378 [Nitzschia inconspicua]
MYKEQDRSTIHSERDLAPGIPRRHRSVEDIFETKEHGFHRGQSRKEKNIEGSCTDEQPPSTALSILQPFDSAKMDRTMLLIEDAVSIHPTTLVTRAKFLGSRHSLFSTKSIPKRRSKCSMNNWSVAQLPTITEFRSLQLVDVEGTKEVQYSSHNGFCS